MSLTVKITTNLLDISDALGELGQKHLFRAVRRSINRALPSMRVKSVDLIKRDIKLKTGFIRRGTLINKAKGANITNISGSIGFDSTPVPLMEFVRGSRTPIKQKGIAVSKRRKLRVEIRPGRRVVLAHAFIQKVRTLQVFKRKKERRLASQGIHSIAHEIFRGTKATRVAEEGMKRFESEFEREWAIRLEGLIKDVNLKWK